MSIYFNLTSEEFEFLPVASLQLFSQWSFAYLTSLIEKAVYFAHVSYTQDHTDGLPEGSEGNSPSVASGAFCVDWLFMDL